MQMRQYVNTLGCQFYTPFAIYPHSTLGIVIGQQTATLMNASITFSLMERPVCRATTTQAAACPRMWTSTTIRTRQEAPGPPTERYKSF